jgi:hypothetical protein
MLYYIRLIIKTYRKHYITLNLLSKRNWNIKNHLDFDTIITWKFPFSRKFSRKSYENFAIQHAWYMWWNFFDITSHFRRIKRNMWGNVGIQLPLGPNENFIFAKIRKFTLKAETLLIWNTWGMGHQIEYCLLK